MYYRRPTDILPIIIDPAYCSNDVLRKRINAMSYHGFSQSTEKQLLFGAENLPSRFRGKLDRMLRQTNAVSTKLKEQFLACLPTQHRRLTQTCLHAHSISICQLGYRTAKGLHCVCFSDPYPSCLSASGKKHQAAF